MKNRLIILLASAIVMFAICGCSSTSSAEPAAEEPLIEVVADDEQEEAVPADLDMDMTGEVTEDTATNTNEQGLSDSNLPEEVAPTTDTVRSTDIVNIREQANTDSAVLGKAAIGDIFTRYEALDNGWSRIDYNGADAYIKTEYLIAADGDSSLQEADNSAVKDASDTSSDGTAAAAVSTQASTASDANNSTAVGTGGSNFNTYNNAEQQNTTAAFVLNTSSMKIHYPSCYSVKKIAPQNYATSSLSLEELKGQGYTTCGNCFK